MEFPLYWSVFVIVVTTSLQHVRCETCKVNISNKIFKCIENVNKIADIASSLVDDNGEIDQSKLKLFCGVASETADCLQAILDDAVNCPALKDNDQISNVKQMLEKSRSDIAKRCSQNEIGNIECVTELKVNMEKCEPMMKNLMSSTDDGDIFCDNYRKVMECYNRANDVIKKCDKSGNMAASVEDVLKQMRNQMGGICTDDGETNADTTNRDDDKDGSLILIANSLIISICIFIAFRFT